MPELTCTAKHLKGKVIVPNTVPLRRMDERSKSLTIAVNNRSLRSGENAQCDLPLVSLNRMRSHPWARAMPAAAMMNAKNSTT